VLPRAKLPMSPEGAVSKVIVTAACKLHAEKMDAEISAMLMICDL